MENICNICFEEKSNSDDIVKYCNDKHIFCKTCFNSYLQVFLNKEGEENHILKCPVCRNEIHYIKNGLIITYHENGSIHTKINYVNDVPEGLYETYYPSTNVAGGKPTLLASRYTIKNGKIDGLRTEYYDNGSIWLKCTYKNGVKDGVFEEYYETENSDEMVLWHSGFYVNGMRNGLYQTFDINGNLIESINYD
jgi:antitoxin component YwqK of YwqJK toxin-antitoxin module